MPILGFCFGHQEIAKRYGGRVEHCRSEYGPARLEVMGDDAGVRRAAETADRVDEPSGHRRRRWATGSAKSAISYDHDGTAHRFAAIADEDRRRYGFQYHPEVDDTEHGEAMLRNFVRQRLRLPRRLDDGAVSRGADRGDSREVGRASVFLLASGGVDSTVCARLLGEALGPDQLYLLHVDNGLMRKDESRWSSTSCTRFGLGRNLHFVDASDRFLAALDGVIEPERKRRVIGDTFIRVFEDEMRRLDLGDMLLAQGTIYPDTIETGGTRRADTIKTHHNRVPIIEEMIKAGRVIEPIRELYKVEVREMAEALGIAARARVASSVPGAWTRRAVVVLGRDGFRPDTIPTRTQPLIDAALTGTGLAVVCLPVQSVGVKADLRTYEQPVLLTGDAPHDTLLPSRRRFTAACRASIAACSICRVARSSRAEPRTAGMTRARLDLLREADDLVMRAVARHGLMRAIWQFPTVMLPLSLNGHGDELVILRPVLSERGMTARPAALPAAFVDEIREPILALPGVSGLVLDLTTKPPGTIEWE